MSIELQWSLLQQLQDKGIIQYIDYALAQGLLAKYTHPQQSVAALICYISAAARVGHVCVKITEHTLYPALEKIFVTPQDYNSNALVDFSMQEQAELQQLVLQGAQEFPSSLIAIDKLQEDVRCFPVYCQENRFYLQRNFFAETVILQQIKRLHSALPHIELNCDTLNLELQRMIAKKKLLAVQAQAILHAAKHSLSLITGGPGTGKTYTAGLLIQLLLKNMTPDDAANFEVLLAAPTGKAAAQLQQSLLTAFGQQAMSCQILTGTLQRLLYQLKWKMFSADLIVVDESSMIDVSLLARLLQCIKPGARLILLGDLYQLPPVEAGNLFADLLQWGQKLYPSPVAVLNKCLRIESQSIAALADMIKQGDAAHALQLLQFPKQGLQRLIMPIEPAAYPIAQQQFLVEYLVHFFPAIGSSAPPLQLLEQFQKFRLLTPLRQGLLGVEALNLQILQRMQKFVAMGKRMVIPILVTRNDEQLQLYNGDVGILYCTKTSSSDIKIHKHSDDAFFLARGSDQMYAEKNTTLRRIPSVLLPSYELAYCLSVHKSQGSEFDHVLLVLPEGSEFFGREVFYTGVTRAKSKLDLFAADSTIEQTIRQQNHRLSGFQERCILLSN